MDKKMTDRAKMVCAMEYIARHINDEMIFESWLMMGVADGDIKYGEFNTEEVDDYYLEDDEFKDLMTRFLKLMIWAYKDGGLYCDVIASGTEDDRK